MKFFKNLSICFLILASCLALSSNFALATDETPATGATLSMSASEVTTNAETGDKEVTVTVSLDNAIKVNQWDFTLSYDTSTLTYVRHQNCGNVFEAEGGRRVMGNSVEPVGSFQLTFKVNPEATANNATVTLTNAASFKHKEGTTETRYDITNVGSTVNITLATATTKTYTVTFSYIDEDGNRKEVPVEVNEGQRINSEDIPATPNYKDGDGVEYTFDRWDVEFADMKITDMDITSDLVVTAIYKEISSQPSESPNPEDPGTTTPTDPDDTTPADPDDSGENLGDTNFVDDGYEGPLSPSTQQTGISIASAIAIALVALLGATFVIKRK